MFADSSARACARISPVFVAAIAILAGSFFFATPASAVTPEQLLEVLRKKGVINDEEYEILSGKKNAGADAVPASAPPVAAAKEEPKTPATAAPAKPKEEIAAKFKEGITWESADKSTWIGLRGRIEADYRHYLGDDALGADTWDVRRAYLAVEGKFYDDIDFRVRMNFSDTAGPTAIVCTACGQQQRRCAGLHGNHISRYDRHNFTRRSVVQPRLVEIGAASPWPS